VTNPSLSKPVRILPRRIGTIPLTRRCLHATFQVLMNSTLRTPHPKLQVAPHTVPSLAPRPTQQPALLLCAFGLLGLGLLTLVCGDFALVWQPVAAWFPARTALAYVTGALEVAVALGLLFPATVALAVRVLLPGLVLWQLLKVPDIFAAPAVEGVYLSFGETAILLAGGWTLFARLAGLRAGSPFVFLTGERSVRIAQIYLGLWIIPIGLSHILYSNATVHLIPTWLPNRLFFAYLTGAGQIASGLGLIFNVLPRVAAYAEAAQLWIYTLLIWVPAVVFGPNTDVQAVFGSPSARMSWTALLVTWIPAACALTVAQNIPSKRKAD
jgi:uncharacterized membrane protein